MKNYSTKSSQMNDALSQIAYIQCTLYFFVQCCILRQMNLQYFQSKIEIGGYTVQYSIFSLYTIKYPIHIPYIDDVLLFITFFCNIVTYEMYSTPSYIIPQQRSEKIVDFQNQNENELQFLALQISIYFSCTPFYCYKIYDIGYILCLLHK